MSKHYTIDDIMTHNKIAGFFFFNKDSMRFFKSRVLNDVFQGPGGVFFVTSEKGPNNPRRYTVREYNPKTGDIETRGDFNSHSKYSAKKYANLYSKGLINE